MGALASQIITTPLFVQPFVQAHIKENTETTRRWSLWRESTNDRLIPLTKGQ